MFTPCEPASVPVKPVQVKFLQLTEELIVTVTAPELASKKTSSFAVGTASPPTPPLVADHFEPAVLSQLAVPPTQ